MNPEAKAGKPLSFWLLVFFGSLALLVILFYEIEDWRGKRAWQKYKAVLLAQGEKLDWKDFVPPSVPDDQNILKAPIMEGWMYRTAPQTNHARPLIRIFETGVVLGDWSNGEFTPLLEWKAWMQQQKRATSPASSTNLPPVETMFTHLFPQADKQIMPLIVISDAPLADAIGNLARQAGLEIEFDAAVLHSSTPLPNVTFHWENITALQGLEALLENYSLTLVPNADREIARVAIKPPEPPRDADPEVFLQYLDSIPTPADTNGLMPIIAIHEAPLPDAIGNLARQAGLNVWLHPQTMPDAPTISFLWKNVTAVQALQRVLAEHGLMLDWNDRTRLWKVISRPPRASVILRDFQKYEAEFKELHEACQRPQARYDIDYQQWFLPDGVFSVNFVSCRRLAQSLTLHSSAALALHDSETAWQNLRSTLALSKISKSNATLVGAMVGVAIAGLTTQTIWEGLASHRWTESQLLELEKPLRSVDLMFDAALGFRAERACQCYALENYSRKQLSTNFAFTEIMWGRSLTLAEEIQPMVIRWCPRGWLYQNEKVAAQSIQDMLDAMDLKTQRFSVPKLNAATKAITNVFLPFSYFTTHFEKAVQITVRNQTGVNQAIIACALERYRLAQGEYPETLAALVPSFAEKLPHDLITGQPLQYRREDKDHFLLYSIGLDEKDDGGSPAATYNGPGDWVWRYPKM